MLSDFWRDLISLVSLGLTVVGFILTALGLWYAILQIRKTKSAVEAAEEAANRALTESERNFQRYAAANAHRFINEAKMHVDGKAWEKAAMRLSDLADQVAQLASADEEWRQLIDELRDFAAVCMRVHGGLRKPFTKNKWDSFSVRLQRKIDHYHRPFTAPREEVSDDPGQQIP